MSDRPGRYLEVRRNSIAIVLIAAFAVGLMLIMMGLFSWPMILPGLLLILYFDGQTKDGRLLDPTSWVRGLHGERAVAKALERLPAGYRVIHDLDIGRGNVDHVVIGPTGVFAIETKAWSGRLLARAGRLLHNGRDAAETRRQAVSGALAVRRHLDAAGMSHTWVEAIIVSTRALVENGELELPQTKVLDVNALVPHIERSRQSLSPEQVARAADAVTRPLGTLSA
ncbi:MAG TPA: nuclease-related domain-containing protein [Actinomycetota bacterium]